MRTEPKRTLEREYQEGKVMPAQYLTQLQILEARGYAEPLDVLTAAKSQYCSRHLAYEGFAPIAVQHETGLVECLNARFPPRETQSVRQNILAAWYLTKTISGDTHILIQDTQETGSTVWMDRSLRHLTVDVLPTNTIRTQVSGFREDIMPIIRDALGVDSGPHYESWWTEWRIDAESALRNILQYTLQNQ